MHLAFIRCDALFVWAQAAQAHASRKRGIYKLFMVLEPGRDLRERPVLGYKRPLTTWDFVWGIKYRRFRTWKKTQFQYFSSEMNKTNLPLASLCVFGIISLFWAFFVMTVTTFIRRSQGTTLFYVGDSNLSTRRRFAARKSILSQFFSARGKALWSPHLVKSSFAKYPRAFPWKWAFSHSVSKIPSFGGR